MITAAPLHLVRLGVLGHVGRFRAADAGVYPRGARVICRSPRGLEVGEVLNRVTGTSAGDLADGPLLRSVTAQDELLLARLRKNRDEAYEACARLLTEHSVPAVLVDVEQLFDGKSLFFYFMGKVPSDVQPLVDQLGEAYEAKVKFRDFATAVEEGCGPGCGTEDAAGCSSGGCSTCSLVAACKSGD